MSCTGRDAVYGLVFKGGAAVPAVFLLKDIGATRACPLAEKQGDAYAMVTITRR